MKMKSIHRFAFAGLLVAFGAALTPKATAAPPSFVRIPAGTFQMGSPVGEIGRDITETQHSVTLTRDFEMQNLPVTQQQWVDVMGTNPSAFQSPRSCTDYRVVNGVSLCPNHPVEQVSWNDVAAFVKKVNATANDGYTYRLPTEAEWEYAARAGTQTAYSFGNDESQLGQYAWWGANTYVLETHDVGGKAPNPYGLYDMHGNIWQWVGDWYGAYGSAGAVDPQGPNRGWARVFRGGFWFADGPHCRAAGRYSVDAAYKGPSLGFRLVRTK
ncbi:MAG: formylglycine-generating enzyme family protein [Bdellovibrionales bacterium]|nr:formylglycine-generating enzyme family protein [Bdellovibrionales bacterium]